MEKKTLKPGLLIRILFLLNLIVAAFLFISQLSSRINPAKIWLAEILAISYPYLLILNFLFVIFWILKRHRFVLLSSIVILTGYTQLSLFFQLNFQSDPPPSANSFSVISYNVRLFDLYNWTGNLKSRAKIFDELKTQQPDIICFQEYFNSDEGDFKNTKDLLKFIKAEHAHVVYGITLRKTEHWGLATFTRFPIVNKGRVIYEEGKTNFGIYTDVKLDNDTIRIYNVHLQSIHLKETDYRFIEAPDSGSNEQIIQSAKSILRRLKEGAIKRASQVEELKMHMNNSPYPVILCGDFNDPPFSYAYNVLSEGLTDSFKSNGKGTGITYIGKIPFFRIDYVLYDEKFECNSHEVLDFRYSDHKPVKVVLMKKLRINN